MLMKPFLYPKLNKHSLLISIEVHIFLESSYGLVGMLYSVNWTE